MGTPEDLHTYIDNTEQKNDNESLITEDISSSPPPNNATSVEATQLRKKLRFFFMNPVQKWQTKRRLPYKFVIQVIKIFLVTYQLCVFAENRYKHLNYATNNKLTFSRIFIKDWDASKEVVSYPPISGPMAVCQISDLISNVEYSMNKFSQLDDTVGVFEYYRNPNSLPAPAKICLEYYSKKDLKNEPDVLSRCFEVEVPNATDFKLTELFEKHNFTIDYRLLLELKLKFSIVAFSYKPGGARCSLFDIPIIFNNRDMDGLMTISLETELKMFNCLAEQATTRANGYELMWHDILNFFIIFICFVSLILCTRAVIRAQMLKNYTMKYFKEVRGSELSMEGRLEFWNFWYLMIIVNDVLNIVGSYMEGKISRNEYATTEWSICSLCLGTGTMLVWFGVLRYCGFFKNYNIVILTLKRAFPEMMRFLLCTLIIYAGFIFCGWLVLGPFHIKFRSLSRTSENLFSLVNGDDMFATFTILNSESGILWWYSRIYLYGFISLFIYVVLNLFMAVILDAYETIKEYYTTGYPKSDLQRFISESSVEEEVNCYYDDCDVTVTQMDHIHGPCCFLRSLFCWRSIRVPYFECN